MADADIEAFSNTDYVKKYTLSLKIKNFHQYVVIISPAYYEGGRRWHMTLDFGHNYWAESPSTSSIYLCGETAEQFGDLKLVRFSVLNESGRVLRSRNVHISSMMNPGALFCPGASVGFHDYTGFLSDSSISRIDCEIFVKLEDKKRLKLVGCQQQCKVVSGFAQILGSKHFSDVKIKCGGKVFDCAKAILAGRSNVFRTMFENDMQESRTGEVFVEDVPAEIMEEVVKYIYTDKVDEGVLAEMVDQLLAAGHKYELEGLKEICEKYLGNNIKGDNALDLMDLARLYSLGPLKLKVMAFIKNTDLSVIKL